MRGVAGLGWYAIFFPKWVYGVVVAVMAIVGAGGVRLLWSERARVWRLRMGGYLPEVLFLVSVPVVVIAAVEAAYFTLNIPTDGVAEQGRYLFPAITALSALCIGGCIGLGGRRHALTLASFLVGALATMTLASQFLMFATFYS
jgi:hypothetical protein